MNTVIHHTVGPSRPIRASVPEAEPAVTPLRVFVVLTVWLACALAVIATGALDGSLIGTLATIFVAVDATIFTKRYLQ